HQYLFPNWVDENFINPDTAKEHSFFNNEKFQVLYSGNIGAKQDWDLFIELVKKIENDSTIEFIVVGDGGMKTELQNSISSLSNVLIYDPVPYAELNDLLCGANLHVLFQKNEVIDTVMPSKILGMMCSRIPSLVTGNLKSEVATVFSKSKGGVYLDGSSVDDAITEIYRYKNDANLGNKAGLKARNFVVNQFSSDKVLANFSQKLAETIGR
ncbi:MAG: colanic acid biosynthesis glycosyl transferase WcaI, partial [Salibacteraceae bacterium]